METIRVVLIMKPTFSFFSLCRTQNQNGKSDILRDHSPYVKVFPWQIWRAFLGNIPWEFFKLCFVPKAEKFIPLFSFYELTSWMQFLLSKLNLSPNLVDKNYDIPLRNLGDLPPKPSLLKKFNKSSFSYNYFFEILLTRRNASAPGLNGIPYKVYKKCSKISKFLFKIFKACFKRYEIPIQLRSAQEIHILKVSNPCENKLSDFR